MPLRPTRIALLLALAIALAAPAGASAQDLGSPCPATFEVLHNDRIGQLELAAGPYTLSVLGGLSCASASDLFRQFLEDWDGRLPRPWVLDPDSATFTRGAGGELGFIATAAGGNSGGGGGGHHGSLACPSYFTVLHNDRIGSFLIPQGRYRITLLSFGNLSCSQASSLLTRFLQDFDGRLPRPWFLDPGTGSFLRGARNVGFRLKEWVGPPTPSGGGGRHPSDGSRCRGTFQVLHNDRIGQLRLPAGAYYVTVLRGASISCQGASRLFRGFLNQFAGDLPAPWVLNTRTATFTQGSGSRNGFRVKRVRPG